MSTMKALIVILGLGLALLGLSACATQRAVTPDSGPMEARPEMGVAARETRAPSRGESPWIPTPRYPDYLVAIGSAPITWDRDFTFTTALTTALRNLALRRQVLVLSLIDGFKEAGLLGPAQGKADRGTLEIYRRIVDRVITAEKLRDVEVLAERRVDGSLEVLVGVKWAALKQQVAEETTSVVEEAEPQALDGLRSRNERGQQELDRRIEEYLQDYRRRLGQ